MRTYFAPNDSFEITIPLIVGVEYATPTADGKVTLRIDGVDQTKPIIKQEATEVSFNIETPSVAAGTLKNIPFIVQIPTTLGSFSKRGVISVVDLLDIPATVDDILNLIGLHLFEINENNIDLVGAYLKYFKLLKPEFHSLRISDDTLNKQFGDLIALTSALDLIPSLAVRLDKKRSTENGDVTRLATSEDLANLKKDLEDRLSSLMSDLSDYIDSSELAINPVFQFVPIYQHSIGV